MDLLEPMVAVWGVERLSVLISVPVLSSQFSVVSCWRRAASAGHGPRCNRYTTNSLRCGKDGLDGCEERMDGMGGGWADAAVRRADGIGPGQEGGEKGEKGGGGRTPGDAGADRGLDAR